MKKSLLLLAFISGIQILSAQYCGNSGAGQCNSPGQLTSAGFGPPFMQAAPLINGTISTTVIEFLNWDTMQLAGTTVTIDSLTFDTINNLPAGLCWSTNQPTNTFANSEDGCIKLTGTVCAAPGQYKLNISIDLYIHGLGLFSINLTATGEYYILRVNNSGEATIAVDTNGLAAGTLAATQLYGPTANCQVGPPTVSLGSNQTICNNSQVILDPVIAGGTAPFTYSWQYTGNALSCNTCGTPTATINQTSTYTVAITDANGYTAVATATYTVSAANNSISLLTANSNITCSVAVDSTVLTVAGGTLPFTLNWGDGNTQTDATTTAPEHNYTVPGIYPINITDANGCSSAVFDTILNTGIIITINNTVQPNCWGTASGSIQLNATGGTQPYSYTWNNGSTGNPLTGILADNYDVTVTDAASCSAIFSYYLSPLSDPWGYYIYLTPGAANCANNGTITGNVYGGLPPYSYLWSNSSTTQNISALASGNYNVTVSDSAGCQTTGSAFVNSNCFSYINGIAFIDSNNNCTYDAGESPFTNLYITAVSSTGDYFYGNTDNLGNYSIAVSDTGTFTLTAYNYYSFYGGCGNLAFCNNNNQTVYVPVLGDTVNGNNIGYSGASGFNLGIHPGWTTADPGFTKQYWVFYYNSSVIPFTGPGTITFNYDPNLIYLYTDETPAPNVDTINHILTWSVDFVPSLYNGYWEQLDGYFQVPATLSLNYQLQSTFTITPKIGDCDTSDNQYSYSDLVTGSHDPNEKTVSPSGPVTADDSVLTYTIHFQNTGTDSTHFIVIRDTLSPNLDPATVRNIASSDAYSKFGISGSGILTWTFNPLRVVDSTTNPSGSKRFIMFTVHKKPNLPIGTTINNTASVYFDYNTAVVTNTVSDTEALPTYIFEVSNNSNVSVKAFPNPFNDVTHIVVTGINEKFGFELYDVTGRLQQSLPSIDNNQFDVHRGQLANGVYLYRILVTGKPAAYGKLVVE
jgi:uncharacterized repeat protein (TIGR01451 family)